MQRIWDLPIWDQDLIRAQPEPKAYLVGEELLQYVRDITAACHEWSNDERVYRQVLDERGLIVAVLSYDVQDWFNWRTT